MRQAERFHLTEILRQAGADSNIPVDLEFLSGSPRGREHKSLDGKEGVLFS